VFVATERAQELQHLEIKRLVLGGVNMGYPARVQTNPNCAADPDIDQQTDQLMGWLNSAARSARRPKGYHDKCLSRLCWNRVSHPASSHHLEFFEFLQIGESPTGAAERGAVGISPPRLSPPAQLEV